jgi:hypothetical protein
VVPVPVLSQVDFVEFAKWCNRTVPSKRLELQNSWWVCQRQDITAKAGTLQYHLSASSVPRPESPVD